MRRHFALMLLFTGALSACGPIGYIREVAQGASDDFEAAERASAEQRAPYYWATAREYLQRARLEASRSHFEVARRYGERAREAARRAREEALTPGAEPTPQKGAP
jgi:hypothetical protein